MIQYFIDHPEAFAALMSAIATALAAYATLRGPMSAAKLAERLRREGEASNEKRRMKMFVFSSLMQERASIAAPDSVRALNLIDVVFAGSPKVREAWAEVFATFDQNKGVPPHVQDDRLRALYRAMADDIGLGDDLRLDDLTRVYYPNVMAEEDRLRDLERRAALLRLTPQTSPNANAASQQLIDSKFPPKPDPV